MTAAPHLPDDENAEVLRQMIESGDDLSLPRDIDFYFLFSSFAQAEAFATEAAALDDVEVGLAAPAEDPETEDSETEDPEIEVRVVRHMVPTHAGITVFESELWVMAQSHGGEADGWGCEQIDRLH